jgi:hypothetical protein
MRVGLVSAKHQDIFDSFDFAEAEVVESCTVFLLPTERPLRSRGLVLQQIARFHDTLMQFDLSCIKTKKPISICKRRNEEAFKYVPRYFACAPFFFTNAPPECRPLTPPGLFFRIGPARQHITRSPTPTNSTSFS